MPLRIIRDDIVNVRADAIVNTANPNPIYGRGTDSAIYEAAGREVLLQKRIEIGVIERGEVAVTSAFRLYAKYIIHTVGPSWKGGGSGEYEILRKCYKNSLEKAMELGCKSVAFPLLATGMYRFPKDDALQIAISSIGQFLLNNDIAVYLVVFDRESFELSTKLFYSVNAFIDEHYVEKKEYEEYWLYDKYSYSANKKADGNNKSEQFQKQEKVEEEEKSIEKKSPRSLEVESISFKKVETFQQELFRFVDERGMTDVEVYKRANINRRLFSKIRGDINYKPQKKTAIALSIALKLSLIEMKDFLQRAGFALSPSSTFDLIIEYFIENQIYDIHMINAVLFKYEQQTLG